MSSASEHEVARLTEELARERRERIEAEAIAAKANRELVELQRVEEQLKRSQAQLLLADRMLSVGTLAGGVAHEINNPLAYVIANLDFIDEALRSLRQRVKDDELAELEEVVGDARQGADRVRRIVRDLKTFSRADDDRRGPVDLKRVLELSISLASTEIRHRARLVQNYSDAPRVEASESRLAQVFLNLLINAAHAIPLGGADKNEIRLVVRTRADGSAVVEVRDTGSGIPPNQLTRIFDPFFTTKTIGGGTGLGLSICHGIVSALGGEITVESEVGKGTTFTVVLPAAKLEAAARKAPEPGVPVAPKRARLMIVDDEPMIGTALRRALVKEHDCVVFQDAREALALINAGERFDAVLCDLMMPEMTGMQFHAEILRSVPALTERLIFMTGGAFLPAAREFLDREGMHRIDKPVDVPSLRALIRTLVG
jgi:signal transduction histidine kinase/CheY-like chemotaxis protein